MTLTPSPFVFAGEFRGRDGTPGLPGPGSAAWTALQVVVVGSVRQAPDGSWIKSTTARTTRATFDTTEAGFWQSTIATSATDQAALSVLADARIVAAQPWYTIKPTGTNDHLLIRDAVVAGHTNLDLAAGTWAFGNTIPTLGTSYYGANTNVRIRGQGEGKTIIQMGAGVAFGLAWRGAKTQVGSTNPISDVAAGATSLTTGSDLTASIAVGNRLLISSNAYFGSRFYHRVAEWVQVAAITSTTITLVAPLRFGYASTASIKLWRYDLLAGSALSNLTILGHPSATVRQRPVWFQYCDDPQVADVAIDGRRIAVGVEIEECLNGLVRDTVCDNVLDLGNSTLYTWEGYGVRTRGTVDTEIRNLRGTGCKHLHDDSSFDEEAPALRTRVVGGVATNCVSTGWSTHGGSDEISYEGTKAVNCGGAFALRGRAAKGRGVIVDRITNPATDIYGTTLGALPQTYRHALAVGELEDITDTGGTRSLGAVGLDWEFASVDMTGGDSTCHIFGLQYALVDKARLSFGREATLSGGGKAIQAQHVDLFQNFEARGRIVNATTATVVDIAPSASGVAMHRVDIELDVDGYNGTVAHLGGKTTSGGSRASDVRCVIRAASKNAAYSTSDPTVLVDGWWDASVKTLDLGGSRLRESTLASIATGTANGGAGLTTNLYHRVPSVFSDGILGNPALLDSAGLLPTSLLPATVPLLVGGVLPVADLGLTRLPVLPDFSPTSGYYYFAGSPTTASTALMSTNGEFRSAPVFIPKAVTITRLGGRISTAGSAGSLYRIGVYADDGTGKPGAPVIDAGTLDGTSATSQEITLGASVTIGPGWYHFGGAPQGGAATGPTVESVNTALGLVSGGGYPISPNGTTMPTSSQTVVGYRSTGVTGALPSPLASIVGGGSAPRLFYKVA